MPLEPPAGRVLATLSRAVALRCPRCGETRLFPPVPARAGPRPLARLTAWFRMADSCALCGLRFERAQGYWVGAIYVNYAVTTVIAVGGYLLLWNTTSLSTGAQLALWVPFVVLFPLWFFRWSRSLWLAMELLVNPEP